MKEKKIYSVECEKSIINVVTIAILGFILWIASSFLIANLFNLEKYSFLIAVVLLIAYCFILLPAPDDKINSWFITDKYLEYTYFRNYIEKISAIRNLLGKHSTATSYKIELSQIEKINIYFGSFTCYILNSSKDHPIYFGITLKNGSYISFKSLLNSDYKYYVNAVKYLRDNYNIEICDKYNLLSVLENSSENIVNYIDKIEKSSKND